MTANTSGAAGGARSDFGGNGVAALYGMGVSFFHNVRT
ncbi:hypothetical protein ACPOL_0307 [Acidisarcina polymorpha]|uniref:Uncharacterized protein n=1 Tax=Acidisarcina polymorpha TaxID=2211140 RepID=A0A2Z5FSC0_9BACT|nr:hypothetical protein ACPOL_0307 [Acidisarcina polymorpha]